LFDPAVVDFEKKRAVAVNNSWSSPSVEEMDVYGDTFVRRAASLVGALLTGACSAWKTAAMQQSTAHLATTQDAEIEDAPDAKAEQADANVVIAEASTILIPLPFERDPEPQPTASEKPNGGDSQRDATGVVKPAPALPTARNTESAPPLDTRFEASKIPLDLAIFHSIQASTTGAGAGAGGPDRLKKMLSCILVVGGTALTPGMLGALDSR
jgi:actin-related protein 8